MKTITISLRDKTEDGFDEDGEWTGEEKFTIRTLTFSSSSDDFDEIRDNEVVQFFGLAVPDDPDDLSYQIYDEDWSDEESVYCNFGEIDDFDEIDYSADDLMMHKDMVSDEVVNQYAEEGEQIHGAALENSKGSVQIEIEIPADEEFEPTQAAIATRTFTYPDGESEEVISGIVYMGKFYRLTGSSNLDSEEPRIWDLN